MIASLFASFVATRVGKLLPPWLWEIVIVALLIGAGMLAHHVAVVRHDAAVRGEQKAADAPALAQSQANVATLTAQLGKQNAAVDALAKQSADEQQKAAQASQDAQRSAKAAADVSAALNSSAASSERQAKPCAPSETLQEAWK